MYIESMRLSNKKAWNPTISGNGQLYLLNSDVFQYIYFDPSWVNGSEHCQGSLVTESFHSKKFVHIN